MHTAELGFVPCVPLLTQRVLEYKWCTLRQLRTVFQTSLRSQIHVLFHSRFPGCEYSLVARQTVEDCIRELDDSYPNRPLRWPRIFNLSERKALQRKGGTYASIMILDWPYVVSVLAADEHEDEEDAMRDRETNSLRSIDLQISLAAF